MVGSTIGMIEIPGGTLRMGSDNHYSEPQHAVGVGNGGNAISDEPGKIDANPIDHGMENVNASLKAR